MLETVRRLGTSGLHRSMKDTADAVIDQHAATYILQGALDRLARLR